MDGLVPVFGALLVWMTYRLGALFGDRLAGAAACWLGALLWVTRATTCSAAGAGAMCSLAILVRPNLAPLAGLIGVTAIVSAPDARSRHALAFAAALMPGLCVLPYMYFHPNEWFYTRFCSPRLP